MQMFLHIFFRNRQKEVLLFSEDTQRRSPPGAARGHTREVHVYLWASDVC